MKAKDKGSIVRRLDREGMLKGIKPFAIETHYEVIMGSFAYGVSNDMSDTDVYGVFSPPIGHVFPHIAGYMHGFGEAPPKYDTVQRHGMQLHDREYDVQLYSIVKYFALLSDNNPNIIDSLFVPARCIVHSDTIGDILRENRKMFLHKGVFKRMSGYAHSQLKKLETKTSEGKRKYLVEAHGYDTKYAYHIFRLLEQAEMAMATGDIDLEASKELLKSVRRGEWSLEQVKEWFHKRERELETLYIDSDLPYSPDMNKLKQLLLQCLEAKYGSLDAMFSIEGSTQVTNDKLQRIRDILNE